MAASEGEAGKAEVVVDVWFAEPAAVMADGRPEATDGALALGSDEIAAAARFHRGSDRLAYEAAHLLRRRVVADVTGTNAAAVAFGHAVCPVCGSPDHGRPVVVGGRIEVSLSRTAGLVGVAASSAVVGLDIEAVDRAVTLDDLALALHPAERRARPDRDEALRLWVRKEAYLKALGTGLGRDPATVDVRGDPPGWRIVELDAGPRHLAAVAVGVAPDASVAVRVNRLAGAGARVLPGPTAG